MLWQKLNLEESVVCGLEETGGCHRIMMNLNVLLSHAALARPHSGAVQGNFK